MKRPASLVYAPDDVPPLYVTAFNAVQHVGLIAINLVYPLLIFHLVGVPLPLIANLLAVGMIVLGAGTLLQVVRLGPVGSGFLCPATFSAAYLSPSLLAAKAGGLSLVFGMTLFAGLLEVAVLALPRLRAVFPVELSGVVIFMIGLSGGAAGLRSLLAPDAAPMSADEWQVAFFTLAVMMGLNVWGKGMLRMLCALIGLAAGYAAAAVVGLLDGGRFGDLERLPWIAAPDFGHLSWSFELVMALPFAIACLAAAMKALGTITVCQRMVDADWVRPDMRSATRGVLADGISTALAGLLNAVGTNTSTPSVGLASATGVASRRVGVAIGVLFLALGLLPKLTTLLALMPRSVMVSALLFSICFVLINGLQVMTSRLLDARRTLVIGLALFAGAAAEIFPAIAAGAGAAWRPVVGSSLVFATLVGLALNLLFRIGVKQKVNLAVGPGRIDPGEIDDFLRLHGGRWGARPDVSRARPCDASAGGSGRAAGGPGHPAGELRRVQPGPAPVVSRRALETSGPAPDGPGNSRIGARHAQARRVHAAPERRRQARAHRGSPPCTSTSTTRAAGDEAPSEHRILGRRQAAPGVTVSPGCSTSGSSLPAGAGAGVPRSRPAPEKIIDVPIALDAGARGRSAAAVPRAGRGRFRVSVSADFRGALSPGGDAGAQGGRPAAHVRHDHFRRRGGGRGIAAVPAAAPLLPAGGGRLRGGDDRRHHRYAGLPQPVRNRRDP
jgi:NCS2 family nucleobase:cation symporter-2